MPLWLKGRQRFLRQVTESNNIKEKKLITLDFIKIKRSVDQKLLSWKLRCKPQTWRNYLTMDWYPGYIKNSYKLIIKGKTTWLLKTAKDLKRYVTKNNANGQ